MAQAASTLMMATGERILESMKEEQKERWPCDSCFTVNIENGRIDAAMGSRDDEVSTKFNNILGFHLC